MTTADDKVQEIRDTEAWNEGYAAGRRGVDPSANPYPSRSIKSLSWHSGRVKGANKRLEVVK